MSKLSEGTTATAGGTTMQCPSEMQSIGKENPRGTIKIESDGKIQIRQIFDGTNSTKMPRDIGSNDEQEPLHLSNEGQQSNGVEQNIPSLIEEIGQSVEQNSVHNGHANVTDCVTVGENASGTTNIEHTSTKPQFGFKAACTLCGAEITTERNCFVQHIRLKHIDRKTLQCSYCSFKGNNYVQIHNHTRKTHLDLPIKSIDLWKDAADKAAMMKKCFGNALTIRKRKDATKVIILCQLCNMKLAKRQLSSLKFHIRSHHLDRKTIRCGYCPFLFQNRASIYDHFQKEHSNKTAKTIDLWDNQQELDALWAKCFGTDIPSQKITMGKRNKLQK